VTALAIAGSDPSGGAGLSTDRTTFAALGVWGRVVVSAITAQDGVHVRGLWPVPADVLRAQVESALEDGAVRAIKVGMLPDAAAVDALVPLLRAAGVPIVLDPVLAATSGGALITDAGLAALPELAAVTTLVTPNRPEAARLLGRSEPHVHDDPRGTARALRARGWPAVLLKGGHDAGEHATGDEVVDHYADTAGSFELRAPRIETRNQRGTGCALSAAIAAELALGAELQGSVRRAKAWFDETLRAGAELDFGPRGPLPVLGERLRPHSGGHGRSLRS